MSAQSCLCRRRHKHDLRHTGNQLTANAGANLKELMARMGHDSERAALIYLHSTAARQRALADAVGETARAELAKSKKPGKPKKPKPSGTRMARNSRSAAELAGDLRPDRDSNAGPTA
jgi:hypothetical protein